MAFAQNEVTIPTAVAKSDSIEIESHHYNSFFISHNDYSLEKKKAFYKNIRGVYNNFLYGISNNITTAVGYTPLASWVGFKISTPIVKNRLNMGISTLFFISNNFIPNDVGVINFLTATIGSKKANVTLGTGFFLLQEFNITAKGMIMVGPRFYLFTENYLLGINYTTQDLISIIGSRFVFKNNRASIELGLISLPQYFFGESGYQTELIPLIGFTLPLYK